MAPTNLLAVHLTSSRTKLFDVYLYSALKMGMDGDNLDE